MRIVVVEDEKPIREGLVKLIGRLSPEYQVVGSADDGGTGLVLIEKEKPDVVFLDIQMQDMDGLEMLGRLREKNCKTKAVVLTAYSDFQYAKKAIELEIENYMLKPVRLDELKCTLKKLEQELLVEKQGKRALRLERIFQGVMDGQIRVDSSLEAVLQREYDLELTDLVCCLYISLGEFYQAEKKRMGELLRQIKSNHYMASLCFLPLEPRKSFLLFFYHVKEPDSFSKYVKTSVLTSISAQVQGKPIYTWKVCSKIEDLKGAEAVLSKAAGWNLLLGEGVLIFCDKIDQMITYSFQYPIEVETNMRQAVVHSNMTSFISCFQRFMEACLLKMHTPQDIREACIRYAYSVINTAKECGSLRDSDLIVQDVMQTILDAVRWDEIMDILLDVFSRIQVEQQEQGKTSSQLLAGRAQSLIREYYNQGINLEAAARKLHVSEEYLSKQFKKETGITFSETMKQYRIEQVKRLLLESELKLNQIASITGYSDPKYMSKVFKAETGMLPNEYRRMNT